jgi:hypothetical protein
MIDFGRLAVSAVANIRANPWKAMGVLDDVVGAKNASVLLPFVGYAAGNAQRGERLPELAAGFAGLMSLPATADLTTHALKFLVPGLGGPMGFLVYTVGGILLSNYPNELLRQTVGRAMRVLSGTDRRVQRLEMGGGWKDSRQSAQLRQESLQDMSAAFQNTRTYLGREAALMHRF